MMADAAPRAHTERRADCPVRASHILILNWRDLTHPQAGGAERVTHEIARHWVLWGQQVTLFAAAYPGAPPEETIDGVRIIRRGSQKTVHIAAYRQYKRLWQRRCDLIIDEVNTIPFFAPLYAREPVVMFIHQLAREVWRHEAPFPLSAVGYRAEPFYLQAYRRTPVMTVSQSTHNDLRALGLRGPCRIIPEAIDLHAPAALPALDEKEQHLTLLYIGRVVSSKRIDHIIRALRLIHRAGRTEARLWIVGSWDTSYRRTLDRLVGELELDGQVTFFGRVDAAMKEQLLRRAHIVAMTSEREGWGLVVTEANALGTPAVVYDVPGLRDSTRDDETGVVCAQNTPEALAQAVLSLHAHPARYMTLRQNAWLFAKQLNWEQTARCAWDVIEPYL